MSDRNADRTAAPLLPLHLIPNSNVKRSRGRPKKVEIQPLRSDLDYHAATCISRREHIEADLVVQAAETKDPRTVLIMSAHALAREAAALEHLRFEVEKRGRDFGIISSRRASILAELCRVQLKIYDMVPVVIDLRSEAFQKVFLLWIEDLARIAKEVLPGEHFEVMFSRLELEMMNWEERAEARLR